MLGTDDGAPLICIWLQKGPGKLLQGLQQRKQTEKEVLSYHEVSHLILELLNGVDVKVRLLEGCLQL